VAAEGVDPRGAGLQIAGAQAPCVGQPSTASVDTVAVVGYVRCMYL
jgi:hypothetical protein